MFRVDNNFDLAVNTAKSDKLTDKLLGIFIGSSLGDALGAPHEFNSKLPFTGKLQYPAVHHIRFQPNKVGVVGQVTDDTEMTIALLHSLIQNGGYNTNQTILAYEQWCNSGAHDIGKNTRALFHGVNTVKGYQNRANKIFAEAQAKGGVSQSNGSLMRASALVAFNNDVIIQDCCLTNPNQVNIEASLTYITLLKFLLNNTNLQDILPQIQSALTSEVLIKAFNGIVNNINGDYETNRGWVVHAWQLSIFAANQSNYYQFMLWLLTTYPKSDTDTVASICGGALGAKLGLTGLLAEPETAENIKILLSTDSNLAQLPRPVIYHPSNFINLVNNYIQLFIHK